MSKRVIGLLSLAFIASLSLAHAQQTSSQTAQQTSGPTQSDMNALTDARIGVVKAALQLMPEQEKYWPPIEQAIRERAQTHQARIAAVTERLSQQREVDPITLLRGRADALAQRAAGLKKLVDAWAPLYQTLMPEQKQRLRFVAARVMPAVLRAAMEPGRLRGFDEGAAGSQRTVTISTVGVAPR